ncbi:MAG TPA: extracellular solute-binding protein [Spirillospora sp.]|nr:extracellular solute-binding protein [Spirillospora sp.]
MDHDLSRRGFLGLSAGAAALLAAGCGTGGGSSSGDVRYFFFSNNETKKARDKAVAQFNAKHPDVHVTSQATDGASYWDKLAPMVSSGNAPDVLGMITPNLQEYASRGTLLDLGPLVSAGTIDVSTINKDLLVPARWDGRLLALPVAASTNLLTYDTELLKKAGAKLPGDDWTWDGYAEFATELTKHLPKGVHGTEDMAGITRAFEIYTLARGEQVYRDKGLAVSKQTVGDWFSYWDRLRRSGAAVPADVSAAYTWGDWANAPLIRGKSALQLINTNVYIGFQALTQHELGLHVTPRVSANGPAGSYVFASSYTSIFAHTRSRQNAATFLNWLINSPEANVILKMASGPPASGKAAAALKPADLGAAAQRELAFFKHASSTHVGPPPTVWPVGASQIGTLLTRTYQDVSFGRKKISEAVDEFFSQGDSALRNG